jgi:hypothetical protein
VKIEEKQEKLKLNAAHQVLVYANDINLMKDNINAMKNTDLMPIYKCRENLVYIYVSLQGKIMTYR